MTNYEQQGNEAIEAAFHAPAYGLMLMALAHELPTPEYPVAVLSGKTKGKRIQEVFGRLGLTTTLLPTTWNEENNPYRDSEEYAETITSLKLSGKPHTPGLRISRSVAGDVTLRMKEGGKPGKVLHKPVDLSPVEQKNYIYQLLGGRNNRQFLIDSAIGVADAERGYLSRSRYHVEVKPLSFVNQLAYLESNGGIPQTSGGMKFESPLVKNALVAINRIQNGSPEFDAIYQEMIRAATGLPDTFTGVFMQSFRGTDYMNIAPSLEGVMPMYRFRRDGRVRGVLLPDPHMNKAHHIEVR